MSINTAHANGGVLIHAGESIILFSEEVQMEFHGKDENMFKGKKTGRLYLTTHRMIFNNKKQTDPLVSFSFPFVTLSQVELEQPVFGANYIKGKVRAQPNGNWIGEIKFEIHFKKGGAIEFCQAMLHTAQLASKNGPPSDNLPPYVGPAGPYYQAPPPAYTPAPNGYYGWIPPFSAFPDRPPSDQVYMHDTPPPYPGITGYNPYPSANGYAPSAPPPAGFNPGVYNGQQNGAVGQSSSNSNDAKAAEAAQSAAQSAYYDPNHPQSAYVPPPAYYEPPPAYPDIKKNN